MSTTKNRKGSRTGTASKTSPRAQKLAPWQKSLASSDTGISKFVLPPQHGAFETTGFCGECFREIEAWQPGGHGVRHKEDKSAVCSKKAVMRTGPEICSDSVLEAAKAFNERHRDVLDAHDPMDRENWEYIPKSDGNKEIRIYLPTKGLK